MMKRAIANILTGIVCLLVLMGGAVHAAETVAVRAWAHPDFGRIVFDWRKPVTYKVSRKDNTLSIRFTRPMQANLSRIYRYLGDYVRDAAIDDDGKTVRLALKAPYRIRDGVYAGSAVTIDLLPVAGAEKPARKKTAEKKTGAPVRVRARFGDHADYSRMVVDFPKAPQYSLQRDGGTLTLKYTGPYKVDLARFAKDTPRNIRRARAGRTEGGGWIRLSISPAARVKDFRLGPKLVVDVFAGADSAVADEQPASPPSGRKSVKVAASKEKRGAEEAAAGSAGHEITGGETAAGEKTAGEGAPSGAPRNLLRDKAAAVAKKKRTDTAESTEASMAEATGSKAAELRLASTGWTPPARKGEAIPIAYFKDARDQPITLQPLKGALRLRFPWNLPVGAAVFGRGDVLWVVFARYQKITFTDRNILRRYGIRRAEQMPKEASGRATVLRLTLEPGMKPLVERKLADWVVTLRPGRGGPQAPVVIRPEPDAKGGPRVALMVPGAERPLTVDDPEIGDRLSVVPVSGAGQGVAKGRQFLQFAILPSVQGVVISPRISDLIVEAGRSGVIIRAREGLLLSGAAPVAEKPQENAHAPEGGPLEIPQDKAGGHEKAIAEAAKPGEGEAADRIGGGMAQTRFKPDFFKVKQWRLNAGRHYREIKQELLLAVAKAPRSGRNAARYKLARYFFAHGRMAEALGVLKQISSSDPRAEFDLRFRALRGAANLRMRRYDEAEPDLFLPELDNNPEVALRRAVWALETGDIDLARRNFALGMDAIEALPSDERARMRLALARVAIETGDFKLAEEQLRILPNEKMTHTQKGWVEYLNGRLAVLRGDDDMALAYFQKAMDNGMPEVVARAGSDMVDTELRLGAIDAKEAVEKLEKLRFLWRGDDFELTLLRKLGNAYVSAGRYREGLTTLKRAVSYFPDSPISRDVTADMRGIFERLFLEGGADSLSPINALGLYYDFRELTPTGRKGDEMIRKLADRMVSVDLLDRAARLLQHQVDYRLSGEEKSRVAARLAVIYLLNRQPKAALKALRRTKSKRMGKELKQERRHLEARALADMNRFKDALALLKGDNSRPAKVLRADIYWRSQNWAAAAKAFDDILGARWQDEKPLSPLERQQVLQEAISLALADDRAGLDRLRQRYMERLKNLPEGEMLALVTDRVNTSGATIADLTSAIAEVDQLESFMATYRDKLRTGGLEAIN